MKTLGLLRVLIAGPLLFGAAGAASNDVAIESAPQAVEMNAPSATAGKRPAPSARRGELGYEAPLSDHAKTQVLVLGTPHLAAMPKPPQAAELETLLSALQQFKPEVIGVERIPPEVLLALQQRGAPMAEVAEQFGGRQLDLGRKMQSALGISFAEAQKRVKALLPSAEKLDAPGRLQLISYMLAACDYGSAVLQWSYLPEAARHAGSVLPAEIATVLEKSLHSPAEEFSIAVTLAGRLGLQQIVPIDDQSDAAIVFDIMELFPGELEKIENHPESKAVRNSALWARSDEEFQAARTRPEGLLPFYNFINSPQVMAEDVAGQWGRYFRTRLPSGMDRARVAQWEVRNLLIAAKIRQATALHPGQRMLVVIGSAHKPFLDSYLGQMLDVRVVQLETVSATVPSRR